jgi:hypothetical protein
MKRVVVILTTDYVTVPIFYTKFLTVTYKMLSQCRSLHKHTNGTWWMYGLFTLKPNSRYHPLSCVSNVSARLARLFPGDAEGRARGSGPVQRHVRAVLPPSSSSFARFT